MTNEAYLMLCDCRMYDEPRQNPSVSIRRHASNSQCQYPYVSKQMEIKPDETLNRPEKLYDYDGQVGLLLSIRPSGWFGTVGWSG